MKKIILFLLVLIFIYTNNTHAQVTEGSAKSFTSINTNISGNGNVSTHIETTVNGKTTIINSSDSGEIKIENNNGNINISKSPQAKIFTNQKTSSTSSIPKSYKKPTAFHFIILNIFNNFRDFLKNIFKFI